MNPPEGRLPSAEYRREARFERRWGRGIAVGAAIGLAAGLVAGTAIGLVAGGGTVMWMTIVACAIAGVGVGAFVGGMSRLESPQPGEEPSEVARPVMDQPELTKEEHPGPTPTG